MVTPSSKRKRILTGDRPTGKLHLGHYAGSLMNRVKYQDEYETYILVADIQALTTHWERPEMLRQAVLDVTMDNLAVGLDPKKVTFCIQSLIPEIAELTVIYGLFTNMNKLRHNPTTKSEAIQYGMQQDDRPLLSAIENVLKEHIEPNLLKDFTVGALRESSFLASLKSPEERHEILTAIFTNDRKLFSDVISKHYIREYGEQRAGFAPYPESVEIHELEKDYSSDNEDSEPYRLTFAQIATGEYLKYHLLEARMGTSFDQLTYGFFGYPVSQAADITFVRAHAVPVGDDQLPHIELTRDIARKFNTLYGGGQEIIPEPKAIVGEVARLRGLDGDSKMSKSLGNVINLSDDEKAVADAVRKGVTDPEKIRKNDPGHPDICNIYAYHKVFQGTLNKQAEAVDEIERDCKSGALGCVECKGRLTKVLNELLAPFRQRRKPYEDNPQLVWDILSEGTAKAREEGAETLAVVQKAMKIDYPMK
jgi:tryptophanyl-tRNA synthetase